MSPAAQTCAIFVVKYNNPTVDQACRALLLKHTDFIVCDKTDNMAKEALTNEAFEQLLQQINQETSSAARKIEILFDKRGFFSAHQASRLIYIYSNPVDKIKAMSVLEPKLCTMSCSEARDLLGAFSIHNDRIRALSMIKRYLTDCQRREGREAILSCFQFDHDKQKALSILSTVRSDVVDVVPAGGHQGYSALGGLYTQCPPVEPHLYGSVKSQMTKPPGLGVIDLPVQAQPTQLPSMYTGHPSYAYPQGRDYAQERGYPGNPSYHTNMLSTNRSRECPMKPPMAEGYPSGAPPLGMHQSSPAPTGYQGTVPTQ